MHLLLHLHVPSAPASSSTLQVSHVVSHLDVIRLLAANKEKLGGMEAQTLEQLGLDEVGNCAR